MCYAAAHPAQFAVMFRADLVHPDDPELVAARRSAGEALYGGVHVIVRPGREGDERTAAVAAWALVHGIAALLEGGMVPPDLPHDPSS